MNQISQWGLIINEGGWAAPTGRAIRCIPAKPGMPLPIPAAYKVTILTTEK